MKWILCEINLIYFDYSSSIHVMQDEGGVKYQYKRESAQYFGVKQLPRMGFTGLVT